MVSETFFIAEKVSFGVEKSSQRIWPTALRRCNENTAEFKKLTPKLPQVYSGAP